jgi:hypothetical protein
VIRIGCQVLCRAACCWPAVQRGWVILPLTVAGLTSAFYIGERTPAADADKCLACGKTRAGD